MKICEVGRYKEQFVPDHILPFVKEQGEALRQAGHEVSYFAIQGTGMWSYLKQVKALRTVLQQERPDIVHAHFGLSGMTAVIAVRRLPRSIRPKCVITFHNGETLNRWVNLLTSFCSLFADYVVYVAQHIRHLCYFKARHYSILPCGVELDDLVVTPYEQARAQLGMSPDKKYILFGGAFANTRKNVALLREALALLHRDDIEVLEMRGLSRQECALRMCACDLFALPTHSEGSPQALKEAMACNCPIVATDVADIAYLLGGLKGHYMLRNPLHTTVRWEPDADSARELAQLIDEALAHTERTQGRERILELQLDNASIARRLTQIYQSL